MLKLSEHPLHLIDFDMIAVLSYSEKITDIYSSAKAKIISENKKGLMLHKERFVSNIIHLTDTTRGDPCFIVKAVVKAEMKKATKYYVTVVISEKNSEILDASCTCPAGVNPASCKHTFAVIYCLEEYSTKKLYESPTEVLQQWHHPRGQKVAPKLTSEVFGNNIGETSVTPIDLNVLKLFSISAPIFSVFPQTESILNELSVPLPAVVLDESEKPFIFTDLKPEVFQFVLKNVTISLESAFHLEFKSREQTNSVLWKKERSIRITSSNFHTVYRRQQNFDKLAECLYISNFKDLSHVKPVAYGVSMEPVVRNMLRMKFENNGVLRRTGLVVNPSFPYLGSSPDGLFTSDIGAELVEIKCIFNPRFLSLEKLVETRTDFPLMFNTREKRYELKVNHKHYFQIQGQLAITNLKKCVYTLCYRYGSDLHMEVIRFDENLWDIVKLKLEQFYFLYYLPFIMKKQIADL